MTITIRQRYTHEPLVDFYMFDSLGRKITFTNNTFGDTQPDSLLREMISHTAVSEGAPGTSTLLPVALPFTLG